MITDQTRQSLTEMAERAKLFAGPPRYPQELLEGLEDAGFNAAKENTPKNANPLQTKALRKAWDRGWEKYQEKRFLSVQRQTNKDTMI